MKSSQANHESSQICSSVCHVCNAHSFRVSACNQEQAEALPLQVIDGANEMTMLESGAAVTTVATER